MNLFTNIIGRKVIVIFAIDYPILFVKIVIIIVIIISKKFGYVQVIGNNIQ
jgi:hypothetical protein